jgi:hypothetical protein
MNPPRTKLEPAKAGRYATSADFQGLFAGDMGTLYCRLPAGALSGSLSGYASGGNICLVLTPNGEMKIFAGGVQVFHFLEG